MARKKKEEPKPVIENIQNVSAPEVLKNNFMPYAMSVIVSRAIPEIDGLKPSHRKILYTMYEMGLLTGARTKSANVAARTMLLNPHGDASAYEAAVRLTQHNDTLLTPLIDGKGNFGKHYSRDMAYAASRYTEMKLMPVAAEFFRSIRKNSVLFVDNYDSTRKEPVLLPVTFPNILANPTEGIAVGMASSIPSFNLSELCEATILRIQHPDRDIAEVMPGPDFTTGGMLLLDPQVMQEIYNTGRGSVVLRAKYTVDTKARIIEVNEIPYSTTAEAIIDGIIALIKAGKVTEISDVRNEIGLHGFRLAIDYKRGIDPDALMMKLYKLSKLQDSYSCNMTVLIDGHARQLGVCGILDEWIRWRRTCVIRELFYDHEKKARELHLLEGLAKVLLDIDKAIRIIRGTEKDEEVVPNLMKGFDISEEQANFIAEIKLRNLNKDYILNKTRSIEQLKKDLATIDRQLRSEKEINKLIVQTLREVQKKYGIPRKTEIVREYVSAEIKEEPKADYPVRVYVTREGYVKKLAMTSLKNDPEIRFKEGDAVADIYDTMNSGELLIFTDRQAVYKVQLADLKDSKPTDIADYVNNIADIEQGEQIIKMCTADAGEYVLIGFENGKVAKFPLSAYETKQNRKKLINAISSVSRPLRICIIREDEDFAMQSSSGKLLVFNTEKIPLKSSKTTQGVQVIRLAKDQTAVSFGRVKEYRLRKKEDYRSANIPAAGKAHANVQLSLFDQ